MWEIFFTKYKKVLTNKTICVNIYKSLNKWLTYGEVFEWSMELVLKTRDSKGSVGSNPTLSAIFLYFSIFIEKYVFI